MLHAFEHRAHPEEHTHLIDTDHAHVLGQRLLGDRSELEDACAIQQDGDVAEALLGFRDRRAPVLFVGHVEVDEMRLVADRVRRFLAFGVEQVAKDDARAFARE